MNAQTPDPQAVAQALVDNLLKGDFQAATADFDATMQAALSPDTLAQGWQSLVGQAGAFQKQTGVKTQQVQGYTVVLITLQYEKMALNVQVSVDGQGKVAGLHTTPVDNTPPYELPAYANASAYTEQDVTVGAGTDWALPGTLTMPVGDGPFPAVVLVHGSGPNDRNETIGPNQPFHDLALGLASQGIAVLRYDKRTLVYGQKMAAMTDFTVQDETISDALTAADLLRQTDRVDPQRVFVLGHSLGANLAPRIGQQDPALAGLILLAGSTRPLPIVTLQQVDYLAGLDGTISQAEQEQIDAVLTQVIATLNVTPDADPSTLLFNAPPAYWIDLNAYDPVATAQELSQPMLILQGERDYQVTLADFVQWQVGLSGRDDVTRTLYPTLNHLFIAGEGVPSPQEYQTAGHVSADVINDITAWIQAH